MESPPPALSILIVNWNGLKHLPECLGSVFSQIDSETEVVLVDNGSKDGSLAYLEKEFPQVRIVRSRTNLGFAGGNNLGLRHCRGRHVFFLNNDTRLEAGALRALREAIAANPRYAVFACFLINYHEPSLVDSAGDTFYTSACGFSWAGYPTAMFRDPREVTLACAGAAVYERELLLRLNGFDEDFFLIFEDCDLSFRARHLGARILFLPQVKVFHKGSASMGGKASSTSIYYTDRNYLQLFLKSFPALTLLKMLPGLAFMKLMRFLVAVRSRQLGAWLRANAVSLALFPKTLRKRGEVMKTSILGRQEFEKLLRRNWWKERRAFKRGDYRIPL
jgi:GT2 family glycosyltransferase